MSIQSFSRTNRAVQSLPKHLLQFAVDQRYEEYTSVDHAVWRFIMRQNIFFLKEYAHKVYFQGLLDTGISYAVFCLKKKKLNLSSHYYNTEEGLNKTVTVLLYVVRG